MNMEKTRCPWVPLDDPLYLAYHDHEWGTPLHDDRALFEFLVLEGFQAGLSWRTVLYKRENFRHAFDGFDPRVVAAYDEAKIASLLEDAGIIRNKLKVRAAVTNAQAFLAVQDEFGSFDAYIWSFVGGKSIQNQLRTLANYPATSPVSDALSADIKAHGFKFVGSTICYAHMQATGMVNDHTLDCFRYKELMTKQD
jgi:DNA-3-methyladenine glycosylase I